MSVQISPNPAVRGDRVFVFVSASDNVGVTARRLEIEVSPGTWQEWRWKRAASPC